MNEKNKILSTVGLYHALNDGTVAAIPILFPIFREIFDLSYTQIGIITGGSLIIHIFSQLLLGRFSDGKNSRTLLSFGILLTSISMLLFTQANGFYTLIMIMFLLSMIMPVAAIPNRLRRSATARLKLSLFLFRQKSVVAG